MSRRQDWSPIWKRLASKRKVKVGHLEDFDITSLNQHDWWDAMHLIHESIGSEAFIDWMTRKVRLWKARAHVIMEMAWNDHNSEWALDMGRILRTRRIWDERERVTADMVAESLNAMLE